MKINFLYRILLKFCLFLLFALFATSSYKPIVPNSAYMIFIALSFFQFISFGYDLILSLKGKRVKEEIDDVDERSKNHAHKAGFVTFIINMVFLFVFILIIMNFPFISLDPVEYITILIGLNYVVYYGIKFYLIFNK
ncbi:hypothetical protein [Gracilibacillus sp. JCM 18860]